MMLSLKPTGNHPLVGTIRRLMEKVESLEPQDSEDIRWEKQVRGFKARLKKKATGGGGVAEESITLSEMAVVSINADGESVLCAPLELVPASGGQASHWRASSAGRVNVALPWELRPSKDLGNAAITYPNDRTEQRRSVRVSGTPSVSVTERITPIYTQGAIIVVAELSQAARRAKPRAGNSGVQLNQFIEDVPGLAWIDLNIDARRWDVGYSVVSVCVNGRAVFRAIKG